MPGSSAASFSGLGQAERRLFARAPGQVLKPALASVGYGTRQSLVDGDPDRVGRTVVLRSTPTPVAGVMEGRTGFRDPARRLFEEARDLIAAESALRSTALASALSRRSGT